MEKLFKEKYLQLLLPLIVLGLFGYLLFAGPEQFNIKSVLQKNNDIATKKSELSLKQDRVEQLKNQKKQSEEQVVKKKESKSGKVIYEVSGQQFSAEASFGVIFENLLANITNSGIRIRSIEYDYQPTGDKILEAGVGGYNSCEISFVAVGSYAQFQNFFKNIVKEPYLSNIYEVYIEPYDKDKTILINRFKIRLYTKTI